ncbi:MAG: GTP pyrophosphokinase family protein [Clostridiales bacterium]|nr:GTP pyrophosphokinase family protein [Clostridiales bacterium]
MSRTDDILFLSESTDPEKRELGIRQAQNYLEMVQLYNAAIREVSTKLEILDAEFSVRHDHNPIHHIDSRLKTVPSIFEKLRRKGYPATIQSARENLHDIAGVRVICSYVDDIYRIAELLCAQDDVRLIRRTDYIKKPKENGYRSLHLVIGIPVFLSRGSVSVPVEVQIRTIAMDFWASLEHQIRYKSDAETKNDVSLRAELKACAEESAALDARMQAIYRRLEKNRNAAKEKAGEL